MGRNVPSCHLKYMQCSLHTGLQCLLRGKSGSVVWESHWWHRRISPAVTSICYSSFQLHPAHTKRKSKSWSSFLDWKKKKTKQLFNVYLYPLKSRSGNAVTNVFYFKICVLIRLEFWTHVGPSGKFSGTFSNSYSIFPKNAPVLKQIHAYKILTIIKFFYNLQYTSRYFDLTFTTTLENDLLLWILWTFLLYRCENWGNCSKITRARLPTIDFHLIVCLTKSSLLEIWKIRYTKVSSYDETSFIQQRVVLSISTDGDLDDGFSKHEHPSVPFL